MGTDCQGQGFGTRSCIRYGQKRTQMGSFCQLEDLDDLFCDYEIPFRLERFILDNPIETVLDVEDEHKAPIKVATFMAESGDDRRHNHVLVI